MILSIAGGFPSLGLRPCSTWHGEKLVEMTSDGLGRLLLRHSKTPHPPFGHPLPAAAGRGRERRSSHPAIRDPKSEIGLPSPLGFKDLSNSLGDDAVLVALQRPDHDSQPAVALGEDGDPRIAVPELADDLRGRERGVPSAPLDHDLRDMIGDLGDLAAGADPGDLGEPGDDLRGSRVPARAIRRRGRA